MPRFPGAFSAWGMLETEVRKDTSRAYYAPLAEVDRDELAALLAEHEADGLAGLADEGIAPSARRVEHALDLRYSGQEYTLTIALEGADEPRTARLRRGARGPLPRGAPGSASATRTPVPRSRRSWCARPRSASSDMSSRRRWTDGAGRPEPARRPVVFDRTAHEAAAIHRDDLGSAPSWTGPR